MKYDMKSKMNRPNVMYSEIASALYARNLIRMAEGGLDRHRNPTHQLRRSFLADIQEYYEQGKIMIMARSRA